MVKQSYLVWLIAVASVWPGRVFAAEQQPDPDPELLEFLGSMPDEYDDWEMFIDLVEEELPSRLAEVENDD